MKKLLALLMAMVMVLGLVACGSSQSAAPAQSEAAPAAAEPDSPMAQLIADAKAEADAVLGGLSQQREVLMEQCDRFTPPLFLLFFVLSGADLDLSVLPSVGVIGVGYLVLTIMKKDPQEENEGTQQAMPWGKTILLLVFGIAGLWLGGELVSDNAQILARNWGMSESTIGLTIVATATSLPELITSVVAALKRNSGIAIGNVLGSNIMNVFMVLGVSALITPLPFDPMMNKELMILFVANILMLLFVFTGKGRKISRWEGALLTLGYVGFMWFSLVMQ